MFEERPIDPEWMDLPTFDLPQVIGTFRFIRVVNRWLGGSSSLLSFFERESRSWEAHRTYSVLDVGCGQGDHAIALAKWARRSGFRLEIEAIDRHPITLELARQGCASFPEIAFNCADVFSLTGQRYDYVLASMFLHHFSDDKVVFVLRWLASLCRQKLVINDLIRAPLAYFGTWVFTLVASPVFRHDARLSVRKGFRLSELNALLERNGIHDYRLEKHFFYRFLLILNGEGSS